MKGQPYGACQTVTALASGRRPQRPIVAGSPRRTRDVFRTGNPGEASSVTDAHNWAFRVTQKRQPDHLQAAQNRQGGCGRPRTRGGPSLSVGPGQSMALRFVERNLGPVPEWESLYRAYRAANSQVTSPCTALHLPLKCHSNATQSKEILGFIFEKRS